MAKISKNEIIEIVAERAHLSKKDAKAAFEATFALFEETLLAGEEINITNFGTFSCKTRQGRTGTNPTTHEKITLKEARFISFKTCRYLKEKINEEEEE